MKKLRIYIWLIIVTGSLVSCSTSMRTSRLVDLPPTPSTQPIPVYGLNDQLLGDFQNIGSITITDSGFSVNCGYDAVISKAQQECRKLGGNCIKLTSITEPNIRSTCYQITAMALRMPEAEFLNVDEISTGKTEKSIKENWKSAGIDQVEGIYEKVGDGSIYKYKVAVVKNMDDEYDVIYLKGASQTFQRKWREGDLKAYLSKTSTPNLYTAEWVQADKSINENLYVTFEQGSLSLAWTALNRTELYIKLFPTSDSNLPSSKSGGVISSGTGFLINKNGYIVTNHHVIENSKKITIKGINSDFSKSYSATVILTDKNNDLAILKVEDNALSQLSDPPYSFGKKTSEVGESVFALGYPLRASMGDEIKLTNGIISSRSGFQGDITTYQVSVPVQSGNSGGPLFDENGNVVAVISAKHTKADNASYAVKVRYLESMLEYADGDIKLSDTNVISSKKLTTKVKSAKAFVYIIECNL